MVIGAFGQFLASLAWSFLKFYLERQAIRDDERRKIALEGLEKINVALDWKSKQQITITEDQFMDFKKETKDGNLENNTK